MPISSPSRVPHTNGPPPWQPTSALVRLDRWTRRPLFDPGMRKGFGAELGKPQGESCMSLCTAGYLGPLQSCAPARDNPTDVRLGENGPMADLPSILLCNRIMGYSACAVPVLTLTPAAPRTQDHCLPPRPSLKRPEVPGAFIEPMNPAADATWAPFVLQDCPVLARTGLGYQRHPTTIERAGHFECVP